jgi:hypothetical protein
MHAPDLKTIVGVFGAAVFWEAIDYFAQNKLPPDLPDDAAAAAPAPAAS